MTAPINGALSRMSSGGCHAVYWNNIPTPYMVERFNALVARGTLDFEAWFNAPLESGRSWEIDESQWQFRHRYLPAAWSGGTRMNFPVPLLGARLPTLLVSLYAEPSFVLGWELARRRGIRTAFWCEVTFDRWVRRRPWKERLKRYMFPRVDAALVGGDQGRDFAMRYGTTPERALPLPHVIDVEHFRTGHASALPIRDTIRASLGLKGLTFVYVGRLWWGKGLDYLLDAFAALQRRVNHEVSLMLVGDGPEEERLRRRAAASGTRNVTFVGFKQKPELPSYYAAADVFAFPTLGDPYGLVVDEAMACSLPIISTSAAGEIGDRIEDGVNGFIVPPQDSAALLDRMLLLTHDSQLRASFGAASARKIAGRTPARWAENFENVVDRILSMPRVSKGS